MSWHRIAGEREIREGVYYEFDDRYKIGEGGMGTVYLGRRVDNYGNEVKVAIKKISSGIDPNSSEMARAKREASIQIRHENLLYMYGMVTMCQKDFLGSVVEDNYIVMEYLEGIELVDFIDGHLASRNNMVAEEIKALYARYFNDRVIVSSEIIRSVLSALSALHDAGYIHRDIDPRNVFITVDGTVKLIDFGLCKPLSNVSDVINLSQANIHKQLSTNGQIMGKPSYAPPELLFGQLDKQNRATDIYSVGMLFYQLVTGKVPFEDEGDISRIIEAQKKKKLPLSSIQDKKVSLIIEKATNKDNSKRFHTCAEFRVALDGGKPNVLPTPVVVSAAALAIIIALSVFLVSDIDIAEIKQRFKHIEKREDINLKPSLACLCDSLVCQVSRGEKVDTTIVRSVKDSIAAKESYVGVVWEKLTDRNLYLKSGTLMLFCEYTSNVYKTHKDFSIFDFATQEEITEIIQDQRNHFYRELKGLPFSISALDTLYVPRKEYLPILLTDVFLDDMSRFPRKYGEDKLLFMFFSRFEWMKDHITKGTVAKEWFEKIDNAMVTSESNHWNRAIKVEKSERYRKMKASVL